MVRAAEGRIVYDTHVADQLSKKENSLKREIESFLGLAFGLASSETEVTGYIYIE